MNEILKYNNLNLKYLLKSAVNGTGIASWRAFFPHHVKQEKAL